MYMREIKIVTKLKCCSVPESLMIIKNVNTSLMTVLCLLFFNQPLNNFTSPVYEWWEKSVMYKVLLHDLIVA